MKNILNNDIVRRVREEVNDLRKKNNNRDSVPNPERPPLPNAPPAYYHQPPSAPQEKDGYSHTASSTAGYAQPNVYPVLTNTSQERQSQVSKISHVCF